ncbi:MAG: hypothetical protein WAM97_03175 [Acidimicrobiales bacterium]
MISSLSPSVCFVGDVAHSSHQRISIAVGEGAGAVLNYYYSKNHLYGFSAPDAS